MVPLGSYNKAKDTVIILVLCVRMITVNNMVLLKKGLVCMSKKYPDVHLEELLYPRDIPGVFINWNFDANPFFPEREYLEEQLPHWKVMKPLMKKLRKHLHGGDGSRAMLRLAQALVSSDDIEEATARQLKEYPRKCLAIWKACVRATIAFPSRESFYNVKDLRLSFWDDLDGLEDARRFYRETPQRKAYLKALEQLLLSEAGGYEYGPKRVRELVENAFWDPYLDLWGVKNLIAHHFVRAKAHGFEPAVWSEEDVGANMDLWNNIRSEWHETDCASEHKNFCRRHPDLDLNKDTE